MHAAPAATKQLQYVYRTLFAIAAFCWVTGGADIGHASAQADTFQLAAAVTATIAAVLLWGVHTILRRHENTTLIVLGALAAELSRGPGDGAPTGPFPRLAAVRQRESA